MKEKKIDSNPLVPQLRFSKFKDAGEWQVRSLASVCRVVQGGTPDTTVADYWGGNIQWLTPAEMGKDHSKYIEKTNRTLTAAGLANCSSELLPTDAVIVSTRAPIGHLAINKVPMAINQGCRGLLVNSEFDFRFIFYTLETSKTLLNDLGSGNTFKELSGTSLKNFRIAAPSLEEQKEIADCLTTLDELVTGETTKLEVLTAHKAGLMHKLFPLPGEVTPRLRFSQFLKAGPWKAGKAGSLFLNRSERGHADLPIYSVTTNDGMVPRSSLDRRIDDISDPSANKKVCKGDIAYNMMRMWQGAHGVAPEDCMVSPAYIVLTPKPGIQAGFFGYLLKLPQYVQLLASHSRGLTSDRLRLYFEDFSKIPLLYPSDLEQQKISDFLSSIDCLIGIQQKKISELRANKKGLMRQLFPLLTDLKT